MQQFIKEQKNPSFSGDAKLNNNGLDSTNSTYDNICIIATECNCRACVIFAEIKRNRFKNLYREP